MVTIRPLLAGLSYAIVRPTVVFGKEDILINNITLQEAKDSSEIENVFTTSDNLFRAFSANMKNTDPATKEVLSYREALWAAHTELQESKKFTPISRPREIIRMASSRVGLRWPPWPSLTRA